MVGREREESHAPGMDRGSVRPGSIGGSARLLDFTQVRREQPRERGLPLEQAPHGDQPRERARTGRAAERALEQGPKQRLRQRRVRRVRAGLQQHRGRGHHRLRAHGVGDRPGLGAWWGHSTEQGLHSGRGCAAVAAAGVPRVPAAGQ
jgi:hypothetical protein